MKRLLILRHGKSKRGPEYPDDFSRPLAKRGKRDAKRMGSELLARGWVPDVILSSPAKRAAGTAKRFAKALEFDGEIIHEPTLYFEGVGAAFDVIGQWAGDADMICVVGHNPTLEEMVGWLVGRYAQLATANLALIKLPTDDWSSLGERAAKLVALLSPRELE